MAWAARKRAASKRSLSGLDAKTGVDSATLLFTRDSTLAAKLDLQNGCAEKKDTEGHWILDSIGFKFAVGALVAVNSLAMGVEVDKPEWTAVWTLCENIFTIGFLLEMIVKLYVLGRTYFRSSANRVDAVLVVAAIVDIWILSPIGVGWDLRAVAIIRWFRFLRIVRLGKLIRNSRKLVMMCEGLMDTMKVTVYVSGFLALTIYACAIFCVHMIGRNSEYPGYATETDIINEQEVMQNFNPHLCFGNMGSAMLTLFNIATATEWAEVVRPISVVQPGLTFFFMTFFLLIGFGLMNVIIGMIVDNMLSQSEKLKSKERAEARRHRLQVVKRLLDAFEADEGDETGILSTDEFERFISMDDMIRLMRSAPLPAGFECGELLLLLDQSGDGGVTPSELIMNLHRVIDNDTFQHLLALQMGVNEVKLLVRQARQATERRFDELVAFLQSGGHPSTSHGCCCESVERRFDELEALLRKGEHPSGCARGEKLVHREVVVERTVSNRKDASSAPVVLHETEQHRTSVRAIGLGTLATMLGHGQSSDLLFLCMNGWRFATQTSRQSAAADMCVDELQSKIGHLMPKLKTQRSDLVDLAGKQCKMLLQNHLMSLCVQAWKYRRIASSHAIQPSSRPDCVEEQVRAVPAFSTMPFCDGEHRSPLLCEHSIPMPLQRLASQVALKASASSNQSARETLEMPAPSACSTRPPWDESTDRLPSKNSSDHPRSVGADGWRNTIDVGVDQVGLRIGTVAYPAEPGDASPHHVEGVEPSSPLLCALAEGCQHASFGADRERALARPKAVLPPPVNDAASMGSDIVSIDIKLDGHPLVGQTIGKRASEINRV